MLVSEIDEYYADVRYERIAILNALGAYYSYLGKIETKQREKEEHFILATQYYNKASRIDMHEPSTWVGKGNLVSDYLQGVVYFILFFSKRQHNWMPVKLIAEWQVISICKHDWEPKYPGMWLQNHHVAI